MRIARVLTQDGPQPAAWLNGRWRGIRTLFASTIEVTGDDFGAEARLLSPVAPRVIVGMSHNGPGDRVLPPQAFLKSARTAIGPGDAIRVENRRGAVNVEGELAVVMRHDARNLTRDNALDAVLGYTIGNDVTAVDQILLDDLFTQGKNGNGFTPLGPWIETDLDPRGVDIRVAVNGVIRAQASTSDLAYGVIEQLLYLTSFMTLGAGDVVLTGSPATFARVDPGDHVAITLAGIGTLINRVEEL